jgi:protocatechuate 3,4-dioxygenase alpha subunit
LIETWQVTPRELFARCGCEERAGSYEIVTLRPDGDTPWIDVSVFARGLLNRVVTRVYFDAGDVPDAVPADRRETLLARSDGDDYRFDIRLQGPGETVFFDV